MELGIICRNEYCKVLLGGSPCSQETATLVDKEVQKLISKAYDEAYNILEENQELLHSLSKFLLEKQTINGEQFMDIRKESKSTDSTKS